MDNHSLNKKIADKYGPFCALILQYILYWVKENEKNGKIETHFHDGYYWTYNSVKDFSEHFTYLTPRQIRSSLETLKENGLILTANFNKSCDRTLWYTVTDKAIEIMNNQAEKPEDFSIPDDKSIIGMSSNAPQTSLDEQKCQNDLSPVAKPFDTHVNSICHTGQNDLSPVANGTNNKPQNINSNNKLQEEKEIYKEKEPPERQIFNLWNRKRLIKVITLDNKLKAAISTALKSFTLEEILLSISRYDEVLNSNSFFNYKYSLDRFLYWVTISKFLDNGEHWENYLTWKNTGQTKQNGFIHNDYTIEQIGSCISNLDECEV